jgi:chromosomal replication initiation ATPase DnaA
MKLTADDVECNLAVRRLPDGRTWLQLAEEVCARRGAMLGEVLGDSKRLSAIRARRHVWHELHSLPHYYSLFEIGDSFGRHHATVLRCIRTHRTEVSRENVRMAVVARIRPALAKVSA